MLSYFLQVDGSIIDRFLHKYCRYRGMDVQFIVVHVLSWVCHSNRLNASHYDLIKLTGLICVCMFLVLDCLQGIKLDYGSCLGGFIDWFRKVIFFFFLLSSVTIISLFIYLWCVTVQLSLFPLQCHYLWVHRFAVFQVATWRIF